jgi:hypothetical protein
VLKPVVEHDRRHAELLDGRARRVVAVGADHDGDSGQPPREQERLVAGFLRVEADRGGVRDDLDAARGAPVAAADDGRTMAQRDECLDGHLDRRRLAGPTHGEIADGHDATGQSPGLEEAAAVEPFAGSEQSPVAAAGDGEHASRARPEAFLPASNEALAGFHAWAPGQR